jgi:hypothetical protein
MMHFFLVNLGFYGGRMQLVNMLTVRRVILFMSCEKKYIDNIFLSLYD